MRHETHPINEGNEDEEPSSDHSLLVDNIELLRDGGSKEASAKDDRAGFRDEVRGRRQSVDDLRGALFRGRLRGACHTPTAHKSGEGS